MNDTTLPQLRVTPVVECPWCDGWTEVVDEIASVRCEHCGVETPLGEPEPASFARAA